MQCFLFNFEGILRHPLWSQNEEIASQTSQGKYQISRGKVFLSIPESNLTHYQHLYSQYSEACWEPIYSSAKRYLSSQHVRRKQETVREHFVWNPVQLTIWYILMIIINSTFNYSRSGLIILCGAPFIWYWRRLELNYDLR